MRNIYRGYVIVLSRATSKWQIFQKGDTTHIAECRSEEDAYRMIDSLKTTEREKKDDH